jgi:Ca-activated chloride channel family protein
MSFEARHWLWLVVGVVALAVIYLVLQRRRRSYAVRFTNLDLLDVVAPRRPGWRRHVPAAALLLGLLSLVIGLAHPTRSESVPKQRATIVVAIDVSYSMISTDVSPNRIQAAKSAAASFVDLLPYKLNVGLVSFARTATVLATPTTDHAAVKRAISGLKVDQGTAIGDAIFASLSAISAVPPAPDGQPVPARIVLMSDGETNSGRPNDEAAAAAKQAGIPVSTIAFGTPTGTVEVPGSAMPVEVPVNKDALRVIANTTGGTFFEAATARELKNVYADIGSSIGSETATRNLSSWFTGAAALALFVAAGLSLLWFSRLP